MLGFGKKRRVPQFGKKGRQLEKSTGISVGHAGRKLERQKPSWSSTWPLLEGIIKKCFYNYVNSKNGSQGGADARAGDVATEDEEEAEVLNAALASVS